MVTNNKVTGFNDFYIHEKRIKMQPFYIIVNP